MDLLSGIAAVAGPLLDRNWAKRDAEDTNNFNFQSQGRAMEFNSAEAAANRDFQKEMSNTSWQRGTADMMAAGINPMLAFQQGGASSPSGGQGSASSSTTSSVRGTAAPGLQNLATAAQIENVQADTENKRAENPNIRNQARVQDATVDNLKAQAAQTDAYRALNESQKNQVDQVIQNLKKELENIGLRGVQITEETVLTGIRQALTKEQIKDQRVRMVLNLLDVPKAVNEANAQNTAWMKNVSPFLGDAGKVLGSAQQIREAFRKPQRKHGSSTIEDTMTPSGIRRKTSTTEHHYGD